MAKKCEWYARKTLIPVTILLVLVGSLCFHYYPDNRSLRHIDPDDLYYNNKYTGEIDVDIDELAKYKTQRLRQEAAQALIHDANQGEKKKRLDALAKQHAEDIREDNPSDSPTCGSTHFVCTGNDAHQHKNVLDPRKTDLPCGRVCDDTKCCMTGRPRPPQVVAPKYNVQEKTPNQYIEAPEPFVYEQFGNTAAGDFLGMTDANMDALSRYKQDRDHESKFSVWTIMRGFWSLFYRNPPVCDMKEFTAPYIRNCIFEKESLRTDAKTVKECQQDCCKANDCGTFSFIDENIESMDRCILYSGEVQNSICAKHPWRIRHFQRQCGFKTLHTPEIQNKYPIDAIVTETFTKETMEDCEFACCSSPHCYAVSFIESPDVNGKKKRKNPLHNCRLISDVKYMLNPKYFVGMDGFFRNSDHNMKVTHKQILVHLSYNPCSTHTTCDTCVVSTHVGKEDNNNAITLSKENLCLWNSFDSICMCKNEVEKQQISPNNLQQSCIAGKNNRWFERGYSYCKSGLSSYEDENGVKHLCELPKGHYQIGPATGQLPYVCLAQGNDVTPKKCEMICNNKADCAHYSFNPTIGCVLLTECNDWVYDHDDYKKQFYRNYKDQWISKSKPKGMWVISYAGLCHDKNIYPNSINGISILNPDILDISKIKCKSETGCYIANVPTKIQCTQYCIAIDPCSEIWYHSDKKCTLVGQCNSRNYDYDSSLVETWVPEMIDRKMVIDKNRCRDRFPANANVLNMVCPIGLSLGPKGQKCCNVYYEEYEYPRSAIGWIKNTFEFDGQIWKSFLDVSCCGGANIDKIEDMICGDLGCMPNEKTKVQQCQHLCASRSWCVAIVTGGKKNPFLCRLIPQCDYPCIEKHSEWKTKPGVKKQDFTPLECQQFNSICVNPYYSKPVGGKDMCCKVLGEELDGVQISLLNNFDKQVMPDLRYIHDGSGKCTRYLDKDQNNVLLDVTRKRALCNKEINPIQMQKGMMECSKYQMKIPSGRTKYKCRAKLNGEVVKCSINQCHYMILHKQPDELPYTAPVERNTISQTCYCATYLMKENDDSVKLQKLPCVYPWKSSDGRVYNDGKCYSDPDSRSGKMCAIEVNAQNLRVTKIGHSCTLCDCKYNSWKLVLLPEVDPVTMSFAKQDATCDFFELTGPKDGGFKLCKNGICEDVTDIPKVDTCWKSIRNRYTDGSVTWEHYPSDEYCSKGGQTPMRKINLDWKTFKNKGSSSLPSVTTLLKRSASPIDRQDCIRYVLQNSYKTTQLFTGVLVVQYGNRYECRGVYDIGPFISKRKYIKNSNTKCLAKLDNTPYPTLSKAKKKCNKKKNCVGVFKENCYLEDPFGGFFLCETTEPLKNGKESKDCVLEKTSSTNYKRHANFGCKSYKRGGGTLYKSFSAAKTACDRKKECVAFTDTACNKPGAAGTKNKYKLCKVFGPLKTRRDWCTYENVQGRRLRRMSEEDDDIDKSKDNPYFIAKAVLQTFRGTDWTKYMVSYGLKFLKFWESPYALMKKDVRCRDEAIDFGFSDSVAKCYAKCKEKPECNLFLIGQGNPWLVRSVNCWGYTTCSEFIDGEKGVELYYMRQFDNTDWEYIQADFATLGNKWYYGYALVNSAHRYQLDDTGVVTFHSDRPGRVNSPEHCASLARTTKYWKTACALTWFDEKADFSIAKKCFLNTRCVKFEMMDNAWSFNIDASSRNHHILPISYKVELGQAIKINDQCYMCWPSCNLDEIFAFETLSSDQLNAATPKAEQKDQVQATSDIFIKTHFYTYESTCSSVRNRLEIKGVVTSEADCARNCIANDACIGFESVDSHMAASDKIPSSTELKWNRWHNVYCTNCGGESLDNGSTEDLCRGLCERAAACLAYQFYFETSTTPATTKCYNYGTRFFEQSVIARINLDGKNFKKQPYSMFVEKQATAGHGGTKGSPFYDGTSDSKFAGCAYFQNYRPKQKIMYRYVQTIVADVDNLFSKKILSEEDYAVCARTYFNRKNKN